MADDTSQEKKQPLWHKWWFWVIVVVVLVLGIIGSQEGSSQTPVSAISSTTMSTSPSQSAAVSSSPSESEQQDSLKVLNSVAQSVGIEPSDVVSYKPDEEHNQNGPYSRVEYRLPAFQGSSGVHATLNGASVDVVTYHQIRISSESTQWVMRTQCCRFIPLRQAYLILLFPIAIFRRQLPSTGRQKQRIRGIILPIFLRVERFNQTIS